ncbi:hypothetical protein HY570_00240, partial [Candidatus Micrarchaeota archaeon]|nr:hypothetical protein [Candidatus Micrarchaeota archaeon]
MDRVKDFFKKNEIGDLLLINGDAARDMNPNFYYFAEHELDNAFLLLREGEDPLLFLTPLNYEYAKKVMDIHLQKYKGKEIWEKL